MIKNPKIPVVILCGGKGSRFSKLNEMPKQLSLLNGKPLIMHIIDHFYNSGLNFIILPLGFKKKMFFKFFKSKINKKKYKFNLIKKIEEISTKNKNILLFDAKEKSNKLERIRKSLKFVRQDKFIATYGDGISNVNIKSLLKFSNKSACTITSYKAKSQYGHVIMNKKNILKKFVEKPYLNNPINIGFYVFNKNIILKNFSKKIDLEDGFLPMILKKINIYSYLHKGYFYSVDNAKDLEELKKKYV